MSFPNRIFFIWLGSFLSPIHQARLRQWRALNPEHVIELWISSEVLNADEIEAFHVFCHCNHIVLREVKELSNISVPVQRCLQNMLSRSPRNAGALSDIYRFYILREGGWYFDTDVIPKLSLPTDFSLPYGFAVNLKHVPSGLALFPDQIVAGSDNHFIPMCVEVIEHMVNGLNIDKLTHDPDPQKCWIHTENTTGIIAFVALQYLVFEHHQGAVVFKPLARIHKPEVTLHHLLGEGVYFETFQREYSWLKARYAQRKVSLVSDPDYSEAIYTKVAKSVILLPKKSAILSVRAHKNTESLTLDPFVVSYIQNSLFLQGVSLTIESELKANCCLM